MMSPKLFNAYMNGVVREVHARVLGKGLELLSANGGRFETNQLLKSLLWPGASQWRIYYHRMWGQLSTTCSNVLKQPNGEHQVAVNHNQLRIIASEMVDSIDWSHPIPSWAVPTKRLVHSINQCNLSGNRTCSRSMRGNHLAYAATQGIEWPVRKTGQ